MANYSYNYPPHFSQMLPPNAEYATQDMQGDGLRDYYEMGTSKVMDSKRAGRSKHRSHKPRSRSQSRSRPSSRSRSQSRSRSPSRSRSHSRSRSASRQRNLSLKEPGLLDAFRVLYLTPNKQKSTTKFLATKKRQDQIQEILKRDRLGSKRWFFYPRSQIQLDDKKAPPVARDISDQRFKVDADFFRKYKRSRKVDSEAPIMKLKRWELVLYKKLGFIQAV